MQTRDRFKHGTPNGVYVSGRLLPKETPRDPLGRGGDCHLCDGAHAQVCHRVSRFELDDDGVTAVELHAPQPFMVETVDENTSVTLTGSYENVRRYERERKMQ